MIVAIPVEDAEDELFPDLAREVEVDVRHRPQILVEEAPKEQPILDRVDV
jgi:hypothetical protein